MIITETMEITKLTTHETYFVLVLVLQFKLSIVYSMLLSLLSLGSDISLLTLCCWYFGNLSWTVCLCLIPAMSFWWFWSVALTASTLCGIMSSLNQFIDRVISKAWSLDTHLFLIFCESIIKLVTTLSRSPFMHEETVVSIHPFRLVYWFSSFLHSLFCLEIRTLTCCTLNSHTHPTWLLDFLLSA